MNAITSHQALTIFSWFVLAVILIVLLLIARFYQNVSNERTYFWGFGVAAAIFGAASARYAFIDQVSGDPLGDILWIMGGVLLLGMCIHLYHLMTSGR